MSDETTPQSPEQPERQVRQPNERQRRRSQPAQGGAAGEVQPRRRRHLGRKLLAAVAIVVITFVALLPTLASTAAGTRLVVGLMNRRIQGQVEVGDLSLSWLGGMHARDVVLRDARGKPIASVARADTELGLLGALRTTPNIGATQVDVSNASLATYADGTSNVAHALARVGKKPQPTAFTFGKEFTMPFTGDARVSVRRLEWTRAGGAPVTVSDLTSRAVIREAPDASALTGGAQVQVGTSRSQLRADVVAVVDPRAEVITFPRPSIIEDTAGNALRIQEGSRLSFSAAPSDVRAALSYDLARLATLAGPFLPKGMTMAGRDTVPLHIRGQVADGTGLSRLRRLDIAPTTFSFSRVSVHGLTSQGGRIHFALHDGVIPLDGNELAANGGTIVLGGKLDINGAAPRYSCDGNCIAVRTAALNRELATGPLAFLPLAWGHEATATAAAVAGRVTLGLDSADLTLSRSGLETGKLAGNVAVDGLTAEAPFFTSLADALGPLRHLGLANFEVRDSSFAVPFTLSDGRVRYDDLKMKAGAALLRFSGSVGVDKTLAMNVGMKLPQIDLVLPIEVAGTTARPVIKPVPQQTIDSILSQKGSLLRGLLRRLPPLQGVPTTQSSNPLNQHPAHGGAQRAGRGTAVIASPRGTTRSPPYRITPRVKRLPAPSRKSASPRASFVV